MRLNLDGLRGAADFEVHVDPERVPRRKHDASHDAFLEAFPGNFDAIFAGTKIRRVVFAGGRSNHMSGGVGSGVYDRDRRIRHRGV